MQRNKTKLINIGNVQIGGGSSIAVQSMAKTFTSNVTATIKQIKALEKAGCNIVRVAVPGIKDAVAIRKIKEKINIPLVADIHFNYKLALIAVENGADKIRINPGNIGGKERLKDIVAICSERNIPIRVGVNSGSLEKDLLDKYGHSSHKGLVGSALRNIKLLEDLNFFDIVISVKSSSVPITISAYEDLAQKVNYPLHIGITEAGFGEKGTIRSSVGIGSLLSKGIGDTIRVSLTGDPVKEVAVAHEILKALELKRSGVTIISCPTCGRTEVDIEKIIKELDKKTRSIRVPLTVAVMGCAVNGPGEAKEADIGVACSRKSGQIFKNGKIIKKVPLSDIIRVLLKEIMSLEANK